jgi:hypothetical protein
MCYGETTETTCPNPLCGRVLERTDYTRNPPPIPVTPMATWNPVGSGDEPCSDCPDCGVDLETLFQAVKAYRVAREAYLKADAASDAAFKRWWVKRVQGVKTNGARANALAAQTNFRSADLSGTELYVWTHEVNPRDVDAADGVDALKDRAV